MAAKITVHEDADGPSAQLVREALKEFVVTDAAGRSIVLRKPSPLAQFKLVKLLGQSASNSAYVQMLFPVLFVVKIDNEPVLFPISEAEIEVIIMRLDDHGLAAAMHGVEKYFGAADQEAAADAVKP